MKVEADNVRNRHFIAMLCLLMLSVSNARANDAYGFEVVYTADYWANTDGGIDENDAYLDNLDLILEIDAEEAYGWEGGTAFVYILYNNSETFSEKIVGDAQTVSNIDNTHVINMYELWYEQSFGGNQSLKVGLYDLNSEFDAIDPAGLFINSSHGIGADYSQSGENGPSIFPVTSLAVRYFQKVNEHLSFQLAVLDAVPGDTDDSQRNIIDLSSYEGALIALEANYQTGRQRFGLGSWYYTEDAETLDSNSEENNAGIYGIFRHTFLSADVDDGKDLFFYLRYGIAKESINQFDSYAGVGVTYSGFIPSRPSDSIGFAIARAHNGDEYRDVLSAAGEDSDSEEINYEFTYRAQITDSLAIQPDLQYIKNPGTDPALKDALIIGVRVEVKLY